MERRVLNVIELLKLGKKHQRFIESSSVNRFAYKKNNHLFFLCIYEGKFSMKVKGHAVVSPNTVDKKEAMKAFYPLVYYSFYINVVTDVAEERAKLNFSIFHKVKEYLTSIVEAGILDKEKQFIYERGLKTIQNMITLQDEMVQIYDEAMSLYNKVLEKGFFTDKEKDDLAYYIPIVDIIQYNQYKDRYKYRKDFDVIFECRNNPHIKQFSIFADDEILKELTTQISEKAIKKSLDDITENKDISDWTREEHQEWGLNDFNKNVYIKVEEIKKTLRYP